MRPSLFFFALVTAGLLFAAPKATFRAGVARVDITPVEPIWMSGYASRIKPSEGVLQRLWAKALALEDTKGKQTVIVTTDLIGLPKTLTESVAAEAMQKYNLDRSQLVFNSSHTHTGPLIRDNLAMMAPDDLGQIMAVQRYRSQLAKHLLTVIAAALGDLSPATISIDFGNVGFAVNRRQSSASGVKIGVNPAGPVDHRVPVVRVMALNGAIRAILFGYACHNTTLTGEFYQLSGDYAGFAQLEVERQFPGATALFLMLCAGDQNPNPRSRLEFAEQHGKNLADETVRIARTAMQPVDGSIQTAYQTAALPFAPHTREQFEAEQYDNDVFKSKRARAMINAYEARREPRALQYPVQAVRISKGFTLLALAGEVVVDYGLWAQKAFPSEKLIVAGYSNDVPCYIPTARILSEGGYEAVDSMIYYGQPGPFTPEVESRIHETITSIMRRVMQ